MDNLKKKAELSINVVIIAVICLLVLIVLVFIFSGRLKIFNTSTSECKGACYDSKTDCETENSGPCYQLDNCKGSDGSSSTSGIEKGKAYCGIPLAVT